MYHGGCPELLTPAIDLSLYRSDMTPSSETISYGFCHCGCGNKTNLARQKRRGYAKGEPLLFVHGHNPQKPPSQVEVAMPFKINGIYCRFIRLTRGLIAVVSASDYERVARHIWHAHWSGTGKTFYARRNNWRGGRNNPVYMHREIAGFPSEVDHHDRNGVHNWRENLRDCSSSQNSCNQPKREGHTSRYKGVSRDNSRQLWIAQIKLGNKNKHLGRRSSEEDAARLYDAAAMRVHGQFAVLNFPKEAAC